MVCKNKMHKHKFGYCACDMGMDTVKDARKRSKKKDDFETITGGKI